MVFKEFVCDVVEKKDQEPPWWRFVICKRVKEFDFSCFFLTRSALLCVHRELLLADRSVKSVFQTATAQLCVNKNTDEKWRVTKIKISQSKFTYNCDTINYVRVLTTNELLK